MHVGIQVAHVFSMRLHTLIRSKLLKIEYVHMFVGLIYYVIDEFHFLDEITPLRCLLSYFDVGISLFQCTIWTG